jgi:small subunit ribosomal protein S6
MRRYETIFIADNDLPEDERFPILEKLKDLIHQHNGLPVTIDEWGGKRLAYEIRKKSHGYYIRLDYCGSGVLVDEIERFFRIDDRILKYMTVLLDKDIDMDAIKEEIANAEKMKAEQAKASEAASSDIPDEESKISDNQESEIQESETTEK